MSEDKSSTKILDFPAQQGKKTAGHTKIWGKPVIAYGYAAVPSILVQAQRRLGITPLQFNIIVQLLDYWWDPQRRPFPSKKELAERIDVTPKTIQTNIRQLEGAGLIQREKRRTAAGDWNSNIYHLDGLIKKIQALEPEFTIARKKRKDIRRQVETPKGRRGQ